MLRTYLAELAAPHGARITDRFEAKNYTDAVERTRTFCASLQPGTRIVMIIEHQAYMDLIEEARR